MSKWRGRLRRGSMSHRQCNCRSLLPDSVTLITRTCGSHYPPPLPSLHSTPHHFTPPTTPAFITHHCFIHHYTPSFIFVTSVLVHSSHGTLTFITPLFRSSHHCYIHHVPRMFSFRAFQCYIHHTTLAFISSPHNSSGEVVCRT